MHARVFYSTLCITTVPTKQTQPPGVMSMQVVCLCVRLEACVCIYKRGTYAFAQAKRACVCLSVQASELEYMCVFVCLTTSSLQ